MVDVLIVLVIQHAGGRKSAGRILAESPQARKREPREEMGRDFFFFKQKTAYEMIWCWSSDVCSSDLFPTRRVKSRWWLNRVSRLASIDPQPQAPDGRGSQRPPFGSWYHAGIHQLAGTGRRCTRRHREIGRASCRERV